MEEGLKRIPCRGVIQNWLVGVRVCCVHRFVTRYKSRFHSKLVRLDFQTILRNTLLIGGKSSFHSKLVRLDIETEEITIIVRIERGFPFQTGSIRLSDEGFEVDRQAEKILFPFQTGSIRLSDRDLKPRVAIAEYAMFPFQTGSIRL